MFRPGFRRPKRLFSVLVLSLFFITQGPVTVDGIILLIILLIIILKDISGGLSLMSRRRL